MLLNAKEYQRTPPTGNRYAKALSKVPSVAEREYEWIAENPLRKIPARKEPRGRVRFLTAEERAALLAACEAESAELHALVTCALCTGARAGELTGLRWTDVDLECKRATLNATKNDERRALSLAGPALELLQARSRVRRIDTDLVFPAPLPDKPKMRRETDENEPAPGPYDYQKPFRDALVAAAVAVAQRA